MPVIEEEKISELTEVKTGLKPKEQEGRGQEGGIGKGGSLQSKVTRGKQKTEETLEAAVPSLPPLEVKGEVEGGNASKAHRGSE